MDKFVIHVSCEIVILGSMAYYFHSRTKQLDEQMSEKDKMMEEMKKEIDKMKEQMAHVDPKINELRYLVSVVEKSKTDVKLLLSQLQSASAPAPAPPTVPAPPATVPVQLPPLPDISTLRVHFDPFVQMMEPKKDGMHIEVVEDLDKELENELQELETELKEETE